MRLVATRPVGSPQGARVGGELRAIRLVGSRAQRAPPSREGGVRVPGGCVAGSSDQAGGGGGGGEQSAAGVPAGRGVCGHRVGVWRA